MTIVGYNVDPESGDASAGIEMNPDNQKDALGRPTAALYIDEIEITLTYEEVWELGAQCNQIKSQMEWKMAQWLYARDVFGSDKRHLMRKEGHDRLAKVLCGRVPTLIKSQEPNTWRLSPVVGKETNASEWLCKRCFAAYEKLVK